MALRTFTTTRRKFLERSAMGAGGVLLIPMLLESCMKDHVIPDPQIPDIPPLLDFEPDYNDDAKTLVKFAVEKIPEVGEFLGPLIDIFWPSPEKDVWSEVRAQVEEMLNQKIDDTVYASVAAKLGTLNDDGQGDGLIGVLQIYQDALNTGTTAEIVQAWNNAYTFFVGSLGEFKQEGFKVLLLPLYAQASNMYLGLLRDRVLSGQNWGRTQADQTKDIQILKGEIDSCANYSWSTFKDGLTALAATAPLDYSKCEPFTTTNRFVRQMTLNAIDYQFMWPYFDVTLYPKGVALGALREIYTDPIGNNMDSGDIVITTPQPAQLPNILTVWAYDRVDAVQLTYPAGTGPGGVTTTPRMGDSDGGTNVPPQGGSFNLSPTNPITQVRVLSADYQPDDNNYIPNLLSAFSFGFADKTTTNLFGTTKGTVNGFYTDWGWIGYTNEALSSIHINGANKRIGSADSVVFGFHYTPSVDSQLNAIRSIYVKTPKERTADDLAKEFPRVTIPAGLITDELKAARKAYWEYIAKRVTEIKG